MDFRSNLPGLPNPWNKPSEGLKTGFQAGSLTPSLSVSKQAGLVILFLKLMYEFRRQLGVLADLPIDSWGEAGSLKLTESSGPPPWHVHVPEGSDLIAKLVSDTHLGLFPGEASAACPQLLTRS